MKETHRNRTFSWQESRGPEGQGIQLAGLQETRGTEHSGVWNAGDPQEQNIKVAGMKETQRERTFSWLECR